MGVWRRGVLLALIGLGSTWGLTAPPETTPPESAPSETALDANLPSFELRRGERPITVQQTASDAEGGFSITRAGPTCRTDENLSFYYAPSPKQIDTTVDNTRIRSSIVFRTQPKEGGSEAQDRAVLDFFGGSLGLNDETLCPQNLERDAQQQVVVTEGRTTVRGRSLRYENSNGLGEMTGPVNLTRHAAEDSPPLTGSAAFLVLDTDTDLQTFRGGVEIESDGRTSEADSFVLDEEAGVAVMRGNPARSRDEEGEVAGSVIEYDLDTNDVVVTEGVEGNFTLDLGDDEPTQPNLDFSGEDENDTETDTDTTDENSTNDGTTGLDDGSNDDGLGDGPPDSDNESF